MPSQSEVEKHIKTELKSFEPHVVKKMARVL
ncbi:MAG: hypothetical protein ACD_28C00362G0005, partial [uncultured bacterium]